MVQMVTMAGCASLPTLDAIVSKAADVPFESTYVTLQLTTGGNDCAYDGHIVAC